MRQVRLPLGMYWSVIFYAPATCACGRSWSQILVACREAIGQIGKIINQINDIQNTIASAVEESRPPESNTIAVGCSAAMPFSFLRANVNARSAVRTRIVADGAGRRGPTPN